MPLLPDRTEAEALCVEVERTVSEVDKRLRQSHVSTDDLLGGCHQ